MSVVWLDKSKQTIKRKKKNFYKEIVCQCQITEELTNNAGDSANFK